MNEESELMIDIRKLSKSFGDVKAVNELSFHVDKGELFAFLGVNGAGKSTTISMLCGQLRPDNGSIRVGGVDVGRHCHTIKSMIGVVFQDSVLDKPLTAKENLKSRAALYGITGQKFRKRLQELTDLLDLSEFINRPVGKLSGGQRRRIDIARALIHNPKLLILDEPTTGLDPQTRKLIWNVIDRLQKEAGMTVLLTTHYMEEASNADYVVIIDKGSMVAQGTPHDLKTRYVRDSIILYGVSEDEIRPLELPYEPVPSGFRLTIYNTKAATDLILSKPSLFRDYEIIKGGMDDVFLTVTGKNLGGDKE